MRYSENIPFLSGWINEIIVKIESINAKKNKNEIVIFMIGSTANFSNNSKPYITPLRIIDNGYVIGSIVYTQAQAAILSAKIDGLVDYFFIDVEKKLPLILNPDIEPYKYFNLEYLQVDTDNINVELGNISSICKSIIKLSRVSEYKGNDITIESVWLYLVNVFPDLSGLKVVIYGSGNVGSKLALKLVESGVNVHMITRNQAEYGIVASALNQIKHKYVLSNVTMSTNNIYSSIGADAIIGCTNTSPVISSDMVKVMNGNGVVVDVGKGTITVNAIKMCAERNIKTWRADIKPIIGSLVLSSISMNNLLSNEYGRRMMECGVYIVSGGYIGSKYDVIVDSYIHPNIIIGVCSDAGKVFIEYDELAKQNLSKVDNAILSFKGN